MAQDLLFIDVKYLTHSFIPHKLATIKSRPDLFDESYMICEKCNVICMNTNTMSVNNKPLLSNYYLGTLGKPNIELTLTCDEILVKKLLE